MRGAERGRMGSGRSGERVCANLSMEKQRAPSTGCCAGRAANAVEARATVRVSECKHHADAWQAAGERVRWGRAVKAQRCRKQRTSGVRVQN
eukprot:6023619-Prymnesium_polylepis.1